MKAQNQITGPQLEALTGLTARRIQQLAATDKIPPATNGRWPMVETIKALFKYYRGLREPDKLDEARLQKLQAETLLLEMTAGERSKELIQVAAVTAYFSRAHQAMTATIMGMTHMRIEDREAAVVHIREAALNWAKENPSEEYETKTSPEV